jgi:septal ring factor EnvC (AmiA/AmiB activator)
LLKTELIEINKQMNEQSTQAINLKKYLENSYSICLSFIIPSIDQESDEDMKESKMKLKKLTEDIDETKKKNSLLEKENQELKQSLSDIGNQQIDEKESKI